MLRFCGALACLLVCGILRGWGRCERVAFRRCSRSFLVPIGAGGRWVGFIFPRDDLERSRGLTLVQQNEQMNKASRS